MEKEIGSRVIIVNPEILKMSRGYATGAFRNEDNHPELEYHTAETGVVPIPIGNESVAHYHPISTEIVYLLSGSYQLKINDDEGIRTIQINKGDFFIVEPGAITQNFNVVEGSVAFVVKFPSVVGGDKIKCDINGNEIKS